MDRRELRRDLHLLAKLMGVQTSYKGARGKQHPASTQSLLAVLQALGIDVPSLEGVPAALREVRQRNARHVIEPVIIAWNGNRPAFSVRLPSQSAETVCTGTLELESGELQSWQWHTGEWPAVSSGEIEGVRYMVRSLILPRGLPYGYHRFTLELPQGLWESFIISAPGTVFRKEEEKRNWGVFLPLYALETETTIGSGDYTALGDLSELVGKLGGDMVGTLPLLPMFLDHPFDPSPYIPVTRLAWNEFFIDVSNSPEAGKTTSVRQLLSRYAAEIEALRSGRLVDYRRLMALKRSILEERFQRLIANGGEDLRLFRDFVSTHPYIEEYARFRAVIEARRETWTFWPQSLRNGIITESDYEETARDYHLYAQWLAHHQVELLRERARAENITMYFDLPLGVHREGYDVWKNQRLYTLGAATGAPPDTVFTGGQNWSFPPLLPEAIREDGYRHVIDYIRHHLSHAGMLRIDHVMGLHRLFWIPRELEAKDGVYVHYRAEELYAILCIESHRSRSVIIGEDLGIVPHYVRTAMDRHGLQRMYILHYELIGNGDAEPAEIPRTVLAGMNTHDMPTFATFWKGDDIDERLKLGFLGEAGAAREKTERLILKKRLVRYLIARGFLSGDYGDTGDIIRACLDFLAASPAQEMIVNLEDLWQETHYQNIPGTVVENPNWQHKARYRLDEMANLPEFIDMLANIDRLRSV